MSFRFASMLRTVRRSLFQTTGPETRLTAKRIAVMCLVFPAYLGLQIIHRLGFLLDEIFFRGYRRQPVWEPVFVIGVPRSGTTLLQRLLARDREQFTSMKLWEVLFAPSVTQKRFWLWVGRLDRLLGEPLHRAVVAFEKRRFAGLNKLHKLSLFEAEEDDPILLHIFASGFLGFFFPDDDEIRSLVRFDLEIPADERRRVMNWYRGCVQRHLYVFGPGKRFLSKNPAFSMKVCSLDEEFPDAKIVCTVRDPFQVVPSTISLFSMFQSPFCSAVDPAAVRERALNLTGDFYRHPIATFADRPPSSHLIIRYDTLVKDPEGAITGLYQRFGFAISPEYQVTLQQEGVKARAYRSEHTYSLEGFGLTPADIVERYGDIIKRFGFSPEVTPR